MSPNPRIVVTRALPGQVLAPLERLGEVWVSPHERPLSPGELREAVRGADAVIATINDRIDEGVLKAAGPQLRVVANVATGYDNLDLRAANAHQVIATNTPGVLVDATADLTMALLLDVTRRVSEGDRLIRSGTPWEWDISFMLGTGLRGKRLGIVGLGRIGQAVAQRAAAFGMEIVHFSRRGLDAAGPSRRLPLDELLASSDVVSLHCPLTPETRHLVDADALVRMKSSAYLINTARGPVVDEKALVAALRSGGIAGAGLDVYEDEPAVQPELVEMDNVVLAPHLGSATTETRTRMAALAVENVEAVLTGIPVPSPILVPAE
ncbi:2-hydroxyacid dehydrogenase [Marinitenerispora sediminis]|uniref:D-glycerate dehydrogenase n=1 Tax=Marinitenerispora sediminis TaxID=1931232 RepID=A0A368T4X2_9ACTN|nr:D-glycerate dehydrogenase [Marinitenerispora sediminis]RCV57572.1 D-glycerate dehydrogenase [Marinitenerispora sediminis]RCV58287.1 D-glycerate dehydrogenase [Marinitenerispora sediminis]RCV59682.1 D-glycerate dehydrogenase [Marinitenerispora sediminis]